jgi:hypothetical protein
MVGAAVLSLDGSNLDVGSLTMSFPTIIPINPLDPQVDRSLSFLFNPSGGEDFISLAIIRTFPASVEIENVLLFGDWQEAASVVPEPATAALLAMGLAAGRLARRKRR